MNARIVSGSRPLWLPLMALVLLSGCPGKREEAGDPGRKSAAPAEVAWVRYESLENGFGFAHPDTWAVEVTPRQTPKGRYFRVQFTLKEPGDGDHHVMDMMVADKGPGWGTVEENFERMHGRPFVASAEMKKLTTQAGYTAMIFHDDSKPAKYDYALVDCGTKLILIDSAFARGRLHLARVIDEFRFY